MMNSPSPTFYDRIPRVAWNSFNSKGTKSTIKIGGKVKNVTVQRDILGFLAAKSSKDQEPVDIDKALCYPLAPVPLSLATADGEMRSTTKSKLMDPIDLKPVDIPPPDGSVYLLDLMSYLRSLKKVPVRYI